MIEDDEALSTMLAEYLAEHGFDLVACPDAAYAGLERLASRDALPHSSSTSCCPDLDGFEVCRRVRATTSDTWDLPIMMLTARGDETDRIVGLELGADDYLPKPFNPRELLARLRAILRRHSDSGERDPGEVCSSARLESRSRLSARRSNRRGGADLLTSHQFELLCVLAEECRAGSLPGSANGFAAR